MCQFLGAASTKFAPPPPTPAPRPWSQVASNPCLAAVEIQRLRPLAQSGPLKKGPPSSRAPCELAEALVSVALWLSFSFCLILPHSLSYVYLQRFSRACFQATQPQTPTKPDPSPHRLVSDDSIPSRQLHHYGLWILPLRYLIIPVPSLHIHPWIQCLACRFSSLSLADLCASNLANIQYIL